MPEVTPLRWPLLVRLRDLIELGKPRITGLVILTAALGLWMAPGSPGVFEAALFLTATGGLVASANTLNCWLERDTDSRMRRTRNRPLPAGRLGSRSAMLTGVLLALLSLAALYWVTNLLTFLLGAIALVAYVFAYTPLKRVHWWAVVVGAIPGAIPPLMGWTAMTGSLDVRAWVLFGILFCWQLPHFIAIALYLKEDYRRGGLQVLPLVHGDAAARAHLFVHTLLLVSVSLLVVVLDMAGRLYLAAAALLGACFLVLAASGLRRTVEGLWARKVFLYTLVYLTLLVSALVLDAR
jgi:protoheme IX farnesyltransferase